MTTNRTFPFSFKKKVFLLCLVAVCLRLAMQIPLPCIDYNLLPASNRPHLLALGILPFVQSSIFIQLLNNLRFKEDDDIEKYEKTQKQITVSTLALAGILSFSQVKALSPVLVQYTLLNQFILGTSLLAGAIIVLWMSQWLTENFSLNGSIFVLTITSVTDDLGRFFLQFTYLDLIRKLFCIFYILSLAAFTLFLSKSTIEFPIFSSKQSYSERSKPSLLPFAVNPGATMALISTESLLRLFQVPISLGRSVELDLLTSVLLIGLRFVLITSFSYYCSKFQVDSKRVTKELLNMNMTIINYSPGQETKSFLEGRLKRTYLSSGLILGFLVILSDIGAIYYPTINIRSIVTGVIVAVAAMLEVENRLLDLGLKKS